MLTICCVYHIRTPCLSWPLDICETTVTIRWQHVTIVPTTLTFYDYIEPCVKDELGEQIALRLKLCDSNTHNHHHYEHPRSVHFKCEHSPFDKRSWFIVYVLHNNNKTFERSFVSVVAPQRIANNERVGLFDFIDFARTDVTIYLKIIIQFYCESFFLARMWCTKIECYKLLNVHNSRC